MTLATVLLADRALIRVSGGDAFEFLQGLITYDLELLAQSGAGAGALLSPQGKVLVDFLIIREDDGFLFDLPADAAPDFLKRLTMYKLRSKVELENVTESVSVFAVLNGDVPDAVDDPRHKLLGQRLYLPKSAKALEGDALSQNDYSLRLIEVGIPQAPVDYTLGDVFPHDINLDQMNGIGFQKGCFVGQEVVSRVKHRGTARKRFVLVSAQQDLPAPGTELEAGGKAIGRLGRSVGHKGLAQVRIDRVGAALHSHEEILADGVPVELALPDGVSFSWGRSS